MFWSLESQRILLMERWKDESRVFCPVQSWSRWRECWKDCIPEGRWRKMVDSSDTAWNGPGTDLPERIPSEEEIRIRGYSFAMYLREERLVMERYVCIHGHFYQPPRENPWLEEVELQDSAYPYHDWNERVAAECYAPNSASRILDAEGRITEIVSNYSKMSFNFGPTLLSWLERHQPEIYQAILEADRLSVERFSGPRVGPGPGLQPHDHAPCE